MFKTKRKETYLFFSTYNRRGITRRQQSNKTCGWYKQTEKKNPGQRYWRLLIPFCAFGVIKKYLIRHQRMSDSRGKGEKGSYSCENEVFHTLFIDFYMFPLNDWIVSFIFIFIFKITKKIKNKSYLYIGFSFFIYKLKTRNLLYIYREQTMRN